MTLDASSFYAGADPENQLRDGGFSKGTAVMIKKWFSKEYNFFVFFIPAEKKWKVTLWGGGGGRFAEQVDPPLLLRGE